MHRLLWQETFTGLRLLGITLYMHRLLWQETFTQAKPTLVQVFPAALSILLY
jgi:hypothetical protein